MSEHIEERLTNLNETFTRLLYENICRSLFEDHKLMFSFLLCVNIMTAEDRIDQQEYRFLVQSGVPSKQVFIMVFWLPIHFIPG